MTNIPIPENILKVLALGPKFSIPKYSNDCKFHDIAVFDNFVNNSEKDDLDKISIKNKFCNTDHINDYIWISLDVSLFTSIPRMLAIDLILQKWNIIKHNTNIGFTEFKNLLICSIENGYFSFKNTFYKQKNGLAMGDPLSPIISDIVLDDIFTKLYEEFKDDITVIKKYVDDSLLYINKNIVDNLLNFVNNYHPDLQFTIEMEKNNSISFLDISVIRLENR